MTGTDAAGADTPAGGRRSAHGDGVFDGVRVVEVAGWVLVPAAGAVLAEYGADVVKVEHPLTGDPHRGLSVGSMLAGGTGVNTTIELHNRGKRSLGLDLASNAGRHLLYELVERADVFTTNLLPAARRRLRIDVGDVQAVRPNIVYARADSVGGRGPEAGKPGYDMSAYWSRSGIADAITELGALRPAPQPPGFGDRTAAMNLVFGIAAALFRRERTGRGSVVDVSLLGSAIWQNASALAYSAVLGRDFTQEKRAVTNPLSHMYRTADGRWVALLLIQSDRWWGPFCDAIGQHELLEDERYATSAARREHAGALVAELERVFEEATALQWRARLAAFDGPWELVQSQGEVLEDPQALQNGYIAPVRYSGGDDVVLVRAPVQFDETVSDLRRAPELAEHTEELLLELGHTWDDLASLKARGVIT